VDLARACDFSLEQLKYEYPDEILSAGYKIDGTPAIGINGAYYTSGSLAGSNDRALAITDYLIAQIRKSG
jgi:hypothetical protein